MVEKSCHHSWVQRQIHESNSLHFCTHSIHWIRFHSQARTFHRGLLSAIASGLLAAAVTVNFFVSESCREGEKKKSPWPPRKNEVPSSQRPAAPGLSRRGGG